MTTITEKSVDGRGGAIPVRDYQPENRTAKTAFLWVHGGGFTSGGLDQRESDAPARKLAEAGILVRTIDYRLAPKTSLFKDPDLSPQPGRFPAGLDDVIEVARALERDTGAPINIGGASAGADIAAAAVLRMRDEGSSLPLSVVLAYGTVHAALPESDAIESDLHGILAKWAFNPKMTRRMNLNYVGDPALLVPGYAFPGGADLHDFPPTLILDAKNDRLRRSGHAFAEELRNAGTDVREVVVDTHHGFLGATKSAAFAQGIHELTSWLRAND
jgi:acetyl esterase/lipase